MKIDLHIHTNYSDGVFSPEEIVAIAIKRGVPKIAITDHDCVDGIKIAQGFASDKNIEIIAGIEISCSDSKLNAPEIHVIGLFIDVNNSDLKELIKINLESRFSQKNMILDKLSSLGYDISFDELQEEVGSGNKNYGRGHIARILLRKYSNKFSSISDIFNKLLGDGGSAYIFQEKQSMQKAIDIIHSSGGVAILAHPGMCNNYRSVISKFSIIGGDGIEIDYPYINKVDSEKSFLLSSDIKNHIKDYTLLKSGGSDFHSDSQFSKIGDFGLSIEEFEKLRELSYKYK